MVVNGGFRFNCLWCFKEVVTFRGFICIPFVSALMMCMGAFFKGAYFLGAFFRGCFLLGAFYRLPNELNFFSQVPMYPFLCDTLLVLTHLLSDVESRKDFYRVLSEVVWRIHMSMVWGVNFFLLFRPHPLKNCRRKFLLNRWLREYLFP